MGFLSIEYPCSSASVVKKKVRQVKFLSSSNKFFALDILITLISDRLFCPILLNTFFYKNLLRIKIFSFDNL
jgi:hypothetical protein